MAHFDDLIFMILYVFLHLLDVFSLNLPISLQEHLYIKIKNLDFISKLAIYLCWVCKIRLLLYIEISHVMLGGLSFVKKTMWVEKKADHSQRTDQICSEVTRKKFSPSPTVPVTEGFKGTSYLALIHSPDGEVCLTYSLYIGKDIMFMF